MRLIDIDAFRKDWGLAERCEDCERDARECQYDQIYTRMDFCGWLDDAEIIDAVPVVRCRDCEYHTAYDECKMKRYEPKGYNGCRNCKHQIEPLRTCEWNENRRHDTLELWCRRWEIRESDER